MGFRLHRSIKLMPGLRLNLSKSGLGLSAGGKGFHVSKMANGRTRRTVSIPGTGMAWVDESHQGSHNQRPDSRTSTTTHTAAPHQGTGSPASGTPARGTTPIVTSPGFLAPRADKDLIEAIRTQDADSMDQIGRRESRLALAAATVAGFVHLQKDHDGDAMRELKWVFATGKDPADDPFINRYVHIDVTVEVVDGASASLPTNRTTVGLLLAELLQRSDDVSGAIDVVEQLPPTTLTALSLAELSAMAGHFDNVIEVTEGCKNVDDATSLLCTFRGVAFREQGHYTAARACFADALRSRKRNPIVRHRAWLERSKCYSEEGQQVRARQDLERIMAEDSDYEGLASALAALDGPAPPSNAGSADTSSNSSGPDGQHGEPAPENAASSASPLPPPHLVVPPPPPPPPPPRPG